jgi:dUTP pyrophosphatase
VSGAGGWSGAQDRSGQGEVAVLFRRLHPAAEVPRYAHAGDAGADLCCCEAFTLEPGERRLVGTGLAIAMPEGYAAFVQPRSGLAARFGVTVVNAPGTVDAGYRGEIQVCLLNTDRSGAVSFAAGDRIAQLVVQQVAHVQFTAVDALPDSDRGIDGHGSTGGILGR